MQLLSKASKTYSAGNSRRAIFEDLSFAIADSGCTAIMGPNGCGKSTLLRILCTLEDLDFGEARKPLMSDLSATVLQDFRAQIVPKVSGERNLLLPYGGANEPSLPKQRALGHAKEVLSRLGFPLDLRRAVGLYSGGEQQAFVFARSLLFRPKLWLLDEPISAIDFRRRRRLLEVIWQRSQSSPTLMATHDVNDAIIIARRLVVFGSSMEKLLDEDLPSTDGENLFERLGCSWAAELRDRIASVTHANGIPIATDR